MDKCALCNLPIDDPMWFVLVDDAENEEAYHWACRDKVREREAAQLRAQVEFFKSRAEMGEFAIGGMKLAENRLVEENRRAKEELGAALCELATLKADKET